MTKTNVNALPNDSMLPSYILSLKTLGGRFDVAQLRVAAHQVERQETNAGSKGNTVEAPDEYMASITNKEVLKDEDTENALKGRSSAAMPVGVVDRL